MKPVPVSRPAFKHPFLLGSLALLLSWGCASTPQGNRGESNDTVIPEVQRLAGSSEMITGSVTTFRQDDIHRGQPGTLTDMLMRIPGVRVIDNREHGMTVRIRGSASLVAGEEPLFVIDGIPIQSLDGALNSVNPNTIESIRVLKNADETAIYGSRGANGVIVITTKGG